MASKATHLKAIMAQRVSWTQTDKMQAQQLAGIRAQLDDLRKQAEKEPATVSNSRGGVKANPIFGLVEKFARQEGQLTRRLQLGPIRNARGRSEAAASPMEKRAELWEQLAGDCVANLIPGMWLGSVREAGCEIPEDANGWPNNPLELPEQGKAHAVGNYYPPMTGQGD